jgi:transcriptional regulator with XRE-family HTH domain
MNWTKLISELSGAGISQSQMAKACDCGQSTISEISRGLIKVPNFDIGSRLLDLHKKTFPDVSDKEAA